MIFTAPGPDKAAEPSPASTLRLPRHVTVSAVLTPIFFALTIALLILGVLQREPTGVLLTGDTSFDGAPLGMMWQSASLRSASAKEPIITSFTVTGKNIGNDEITFHDGYLLSEIDGERLPMTVGTNPFPQYNIADTAPVPRGAWLMFTATFGPNGISQPDFFRKWQSFVMIVTYDNKAIRHEFDRDAVSRMISALYPEAKPHVSKRDP
jgi:hypothetical protein